MAGRKAGWTTAFQTTPGRGGLAALLLVALGLVIAGPLAERLIAAPQPSIVPKRWQLDFRPGPLRVITLETEEGPRSYFYLTYTVVNASEQDLLFAPSFELATDDGELVRADRNVPAEVVEELIERLNNPFLRSHLDIMGELRQGEENARDGLVTFPAENLNVDQITVFAAGFSGETRRIVKPDTGEVVTLRKVMMLQHESPGTLAGRGPAPIERTESRWILR